MKRTKIKLFYGNSIGLEDKVNLFLKTLDYEQIEDIKVSSSKGNNNFITSTTILVIYTKEE